VQLLAVLTAHLDYPETKSLVVKTWLPNPADESKSLVVKTRLPNPPDNSTNIFYIFFLLSKTAAAEKRSGSQAKRRTSS